MFASAIGRASSLRLAASCVAACALAGCAPVLEHYMRVEAPDATYLQSSCRGQVGPPDVTYYRFLGIFISVQVYPLLIGIHVPGGVTARLDDSLVLVRAKTTQGPVRKIFHLEAIPRQYVGTGLPSDFSRAPDVYGPGPADAQALLRGFSADHSYQWYLFGERFHHTPSLVSPPFRMEGGTITLPPMTINGRRYGPQTLPIESKKWAGVTPVNC
jgi:hypothetical protein